MVNTKDKTEEERAAEESRREKAFKERQREKGGRALREQGVAAAYDYLERHGERSAILSPFYDFVVGSIIVAGLLGLGIYLKNRQDGELRLVNPGDSYSLPAPESREPRTQAYFLPAPEHVADKLEGKALEDYKRDLESDEILGIARQHATTRRQRTFYDTSEEEKQKIRELKPGEFERYRVGYEKNAGNQLPKDYESATVIFGIRAYRTVDGDTLSQIAERNATGWGSYRTMEEIIELNNAVVTGKGLEMLARHYGMPTEDLQEMVSHLPKAQMWKIDDPDYVQAGQVISIPKWGYVIRDKDKK